MPDLILIETTIDDVRFIARRIELAMSYMNGYMRQVYADIFSSNRDLDEDEDAADSNQEGMRSETLISFHFKIEFNYEPFNNVLSCKYKTWAYEPGCGQDSLFQNESSVYSFDVGFKRSAGTSYIVIQSDDCHIGWGNLPAIKKAIAISFAPVAKVYFGHSQDDKILGNEELPCANMADSGSPALSFVDLCVSGFHPLTLREVEIFVRAFGTNKKKARKKLIRALVGDGDLRIPDAQQSALIYDIFNQLRCIVGERSDADGKCDVK